MRWFKFTLASCSPVAWMGEGQTRARAKAKARTRAKGLARTTTRGSGGRQRKTVPAKTILRGSGFRQSRTWRKARVSARARRSGISQRAATREQSQRGDGKEKGRTPARAWQLYSTVRSRAKRAAAAVLCVGAPVLRVTAKCTRPRASPKGGGRGALTVARSTRRSFAGSSSAVRAKRALLALLRTAKASCAPLTAPPPPSRAAARRTGGSRRRGPGARAREAAPDPRPGTRARRRWPGSRSTARGEAGRPRRSRPRGRTGAASTSSSAW
mmetsp:Transcript_31672/g.98772  ORF Transcript_31672/g.98772 Transcript_31672/m.98772 type:complete len:270 (+) Transcript_31672:719-1528(+)